MGFNGLSRQIADIFPRLSPQLQRAAHHVLQRPDDVALKSMRKVAADAEVHPSTMVRLARAFDFESYTEFRDPFQQRLRLRPTSYLDRARDLQERGAGEEASILLHDVLTAHGANLREPSPQKGHQQLHADVPKWFADDWWVCNGLVLFDDMTRDNGPTRVVPGSHRWPSMNVAAVNQADWTPPVLSPQEQAMIPDDFDAAHPSEVVVEAPAGAVVIINSALWHSGTTNKSGARRRVLHLTYTRRDLPQQLYQRDYLTEELYRRLSPEQRFLFDIEPLAENTAESGRMPKRASADWWN